MKINGEIFGALLVFMRAQETKENKQKSKNLRIKEYKEERKIKRRKHNETFGCSDSLNESRNFGNETQDVFQGD